MLLFPFLYNFSLSPSFTCTYPLLSPVLIRFSALYLLHFPSTVPFSPSFYLFTFTHPPLLPLRSPSSALTYTQWPTPLYSSPLLLILQHISNSSFSSYSFSFIFYPYAFFMSYPSSSFPSSSSLSLNRYSSRAPHPLIH